MTRPSPPPSPNPFGAAIAELRQRLDDLTQRVVLLEESDAATVEDVQNLFEQVMPPQADAGRPDLLATRLEARLDKLEERFRDMDSE